jgi:hypothetical protein
VPKGAVTAWVSVLAVPVIALTVALVTAGSGVITLPPLSASVIARANRTDVTITNTNAKPRISESVAVRIAASRVERLMMFDGPMEQVAASLVILTTATGVPETVWAVESTPLPGTVVVPPSGPHLLFQLDFVDADSGQWLEFVGIGN